MDKIHPKFSKVIIWGFPLHSHTHSYIHYGWHKGFSYLGYKTHWFHDGDHPSPDSFDYGNALFIAEGYADAKIPLNSTSIYFVHVCVNPEKYVDAGCRLIDIRYNVNSIKDVNYWYTLERDKCVKLSDVSYYCKLTDNGGVTKHHSNPGKMDYECLYTSWATDLLPHEINFDDALIKRDRVVYFVGSGPGTTWNPFIQECRKSGIEFKSIDPWTHPISFEENRKLVQKSFVSVDIRPIGDPQKMRIGETGTCHKDIGYIACRVFKNISYGQIGSTNSKHTYELMDRKIVYNPDEAQLFHDTVAQRENFEAIKEQMVIVKEKHTFINRINDLLRVVEM